MAKKKMLKVRLSTSAPVEIDEDEWPIVATEVCGVWSLLIRRNVSEDLSLVCAIERCRENVGRGYLVRQKAEYSAARRLLVECDHVTRHHVCDLFSRLPARTVQETLLLEESASARVHLLFADQGRDSVFVEAEDDEGRSVNVGEWGKVQRGETEYLTLTITTESLQRAAVQRRGDL